MAIAAKKIGKYVLYEQIAKGGMAEVYRGKVTGVGGFEKRVALKRILPEFVDSSEFQRMFLAEAKVMASLAHANIVQVTDFFRDHNDVYLVLEYIFGRNMRELLKKNLEDGNQLPINIALYIIAEVAKGLDFAHRKTDEKTHEPLGIIHRDVSPQNVMVSFDGEVKIVDFGIVKFRMMKDKTATGVLKGKFGYMSPEQVEGLELDYRSDIFSLGVVLYEVLTGQKLFKADTEVQFVKMLQTFQMPRTSMLRPEVTDDLEEILNKALERDRARRYQSAHTLADDLTRVLQKSYGGCNALQCGAYFKDVFKKGYQTELHRMHTPIEVIGGEPQVEEAELADTGTEGGPATRARKVTEPTVRRDQPAAAPSQTGKTWHEFKHKVGIRFKVALDPGKPWVKAEEGEPEKAEASPAPKEKLGIVPPKPKVKPKAEIEAAAAAEKPKSKSLILRIWRDPKKRRLLIIGGIILLAILWLFGTEPPEETEQPPAKSPEQTQPQPQEGSKPVQPPSK